MISLLHPAVSGHGAPKGKRRREFSIPAPKGQWEQQFSGLQIPRASRLRRAAVDICNRFCATRPCCTACSGHDKPPDGMPTGTDRTHSAGRPTASFRAPSRLRDGPAPRPRRDRLHELGANATASAEKSVRRLGTGSGFIGDRLSVRRARLSRPATE